MITHSATSARQALAGDIESGDIVVLNDVREVVVTAVPLSGGETRLGMWSGLAVNLPCDLPVVVVGGVA